MIMRRQEIFCVFGLDDEKQDPTLNPEPDFELNSVDRIGR
jgi:hypothetical protein